MHTGLPSVDFSKAFGESGALKTSEYLLLGGPIGKYILSGSMHTVQQRAVFEYLDLLGTLWEKSVSLEKLAQLETDLPRLLTELECHLPAWEMDINRHMMLHLMECVRQNGPCWTWSMFGFERLWNRLTQWMSQRSHPEATMLNAFKAYKTVMTAAPEVAADMISDPQDEAHGGPAVTPFTCMTASFDRATFELKLPSFLQQHDSTPITLSDGKQQRFGVGQVPDRKLWRAELHLLYLAHPELCHSSVSTGQELAYDVLWQQFLTESGEQQARKRQMAQQLMRWRTWAEAREHSGELRPEQVELCYGPRGRALVFDRATVGSATFTCTRLEGSKKAKDSLVLIRDGDELRAGRVQAFMAHAAPGCTSEDVMDTVNIAYVHWYRQVPADQPCMDPLLGCPVFGRGLQANAMAAAGSNMCLVEQLLPCKLACFPYQYNTRKQIVVVSRFSSFLDAIPE